jgi:hypothetical protein
MPPHPYPLPRSGEGRERRKRILKDPSPYPHQWGEERRKEKLCKDLNEFLT